MAFDVVKDTAAFTAPFVTFDAGVLTGALVVRPSFALETLAPVQGESSPIAARALEQHDVFVARLRAGGVKVTVLEPDEASPWGAAAADLAVVLGPGAVLMRPSDLARRAHVAAVEAALRDAQIPILGRIEAPGILDGGDVLVGPDAAYVGVAVDRASMIGVAGTTHGNALGRSQFAAIAQSNGLRTIDVHVASDARRLRAVAAFVDRGTVALGGDLVDGTAFDGLEHIAVSLGEEYGAGLLAGGPRRVLANLRFRTLLPLLRRARVSVDAIDLWEFGKVGMTPSLLTLALKRT